MVINNLQDKFVSLRFMCIKKTWKKFDKTLLYNNIILTSLMPQLKEEEYKLFLTTWKSVKLLYNISITKYFYFSTFTQKLIILLVAQQSYFTAHKDILATQLTFSL